MLLSLAGGGGFLLLDPLGDMGGTRCGLGSPVLPGGGEVDVAVTVAVHLTGIFLIVSTTWGMKPGQKIPRMGEVIPSWNGDGVFILQRGSCPTYNKN